LKQAKAKGFLFGVVDEFAHAFGSEEKSHIRFVLHHQSNKSSSIPADVIECSYYLFYSVLLIFASNQALPESLFDQKNSLIKYIDG